MTDLHAPPEVPTRPAPTVTDDSAVFWDAAAEGRLVAQGCADCGVLRHPPRPMCPQCGSLAARAVPLSGRGTVYSYAVLHHPQNPAFEYPVIAALVDLDEGIRLVTNLTDVTPGEGIDRSVIGMAVEAHFLPTSGGAQVPVFRPVVEPDTP